MLDKITELRDRALDELKGVADGDALEQFRIRYLGTKGELKGLMGLMKDVPKELKRDFGQGANALKAALTEAFEARQAELGGAGGRAGGGARGGSAGASGGGPASTPILDVTEPGLEPVMGRPHPIRQTIDRVLEVFGRMGFEAVTGPEVEDEFHNFEALNIPASHPARDPLDNFYLSDPDGTNPALMRSQTSTVQIRVMETTPPPIRVCSVGRVYRPDEHDATHFSMFHQVEGLYVDQHVSLVDLKSTLVQFAHAMFGPESDVKLVPSYFPFTEPSAELYVKIDLGQGMEWMEIGGCGMVDPAVFEAVGYDPEQWTGFAFGLGIERITMRERGIRDIRQLFANDLRFLRQF